MDNKKFNPDVDLYELLGVLPSSSIQEIKKAYRKKALTCHPDKNPDDPKAAEHFHELSNALEILIDVSARAAYDRVLTAKNAAKLRHRELDAKRKKFKEDLEAREQAAKDAAAAKRGYASATDEERLQAEISRLRKEGSRMVAEEMEIMKEELRREAEMAKNSVQYRLRLKWSVSKDDLTNGGYSYNTLYELFKKYGDIIALVISPKKQGSGLIEFSCREAAENAIRSENGLRSCPLSLESIGWMSSFRSSTENAKFANPNETKSQRPAFSCFPAAAQSVAQEPTPHIENKDGSDFEQMVLKRLKDAQEKKRMETSDKE